MRWRWRGSARRGKPARSGARDGSAGGSESWTGPGARAPAGETSCNSGHRGCCGDEVGEGAATVPAGSPGLVTRAGTTSAAAVGIVSETLTTLATVTGTVLAA